MTVVNNSYHSDYHRSGDRKDNQRPCKGCKRTASAGLKYHHRTYRCDTYTEQNCRNFSKSHLFNFSTAYHKEHHDDHHCHIKQYESCGNYCGDNRQQLAAVENNSYYSDYQRGRDTRDNQQPSKGRDRIASPGPKYCHRRDGQDSYDQ
ncbi:MAG: hypothetical protein ACYS6K_18250 [Planctomycetota bacterium]|jgi:hypothetical protein